MTVGEHNYWYVSLDDLEKDTEVLITEYGVESSLTAVLTLLKYEQFYGDYAHTFLYHHLYNPLLSSGISEITSRGWCLVELILYYPPTPEEEEDNGCPCLYYNNATGYFAENVGSDFDPDTDDPTWESWHTYTFAPNNRAIIHGMDVDGYAVYHFWSWCPDEHDQDPWEHNWTTNYYSGGNGQDEDNDVDWSYNNPRWSEDTRECMFAFNDPKATEKINQLEEQLLTQSCGDATEFNVKSIIDNFIIGLCNEYYDNLGNEGDEVPEFPIGTPHDMTETLDEITESVENNSYYQIGIEICEVCDNAAHPSQCYNEVNNCGAEGYEACVEDILCGYSLQAFRAEYNLSLPHDDACIDNPLVVEFLLEHQEEVQFSEEEIQWLLENPDVAVEISDFLAEYPNGELPIAYVKFVLEGRENWGDVGLDILNPFEDFANNLAILESETTPSQTEIQNGIEIFESYLPSNPQTPIGDPFGGSDVNPLGGPDLDFGTDGDLSILTSNNQVKASLPVDIQEEKLEWLFYMATFLDASGEVVADDYLAEFHENESVFDYFHETLSEMVMNSTQMRDWLKNYGVALNQQLIATGGDIDEVIAPTGVSRPSLNESHALTILINDTQKTNVYRLDSYNFDPQTGEWDCFFLVNVIDHFGLDDGDVIEFQDHFPGGNGFIAWWALQHRYGWAPFRTDIWFVAHLGGKI